jgi:hypothetical protein
MTPELAWRILKLHATTEKAHQEIAFELGANQGRVNEVIKHGKWLTEDPSARRRSPETRARRRSLAKNGRNLKLRRSGLR